MNIRNDEKKGFTVYGRPALGCKYCVKGEKLVLFITGLCSNSCSYCPVSELKFGRDNVYANEAKIKNFKEVVEEANLTSAKGCGITGGDPLITIEKTCDYIQKLKKQFGKNFHIHLYTSFNLVNSESLKKLFNSGLDEIRFHADIENNKWWNRISLANKYSWDVGIEIPCIPSKEKEIKKLIDYFYDKVKFINLNELEFSDTQIKQNNMQNYTLKDDISYAVLGSKELAIKLVNYAKEKNYSSSVYYCSAHLKDKIQMGNRIKNRAKNIAKSFDKITNEGLLKRGAIYLESLKPGIDYNKKLKMTNTRTVLKDLKEKRDFLLKKVGFKHLELDFEKLRLLTSEKEARKYFKKIEKYDLKAAIIEEYPTKDGFITELEFLER